MSGDAAPPGAGVCTSFPRYAPVSLRQLEEASPSRAHGIDWAKELSYRKVASNMIWRTASDGNYLKL